MGDRGGGEDNKKNNINNDLNNGGNNSLLHGNGPRGGLEENKEEKETKFRFPILDIIRMITMKDIPLASLPLFHGMSLEDPSSFLFEFDILCRSYNYRDDAKKLKLFPSTLKYSTFR